MYTLNIQFKTQEELTDFVNSIGKNASSPTKTQTARIVHDEPNHEEVEKKPAPKKKAAKKAKEEKVDAPEPQKPAEKEEAPKKKSKELDYKEDVRPTALKLTKQDGGREKLVEIFKSLGVADATELETGQLPAFLAAVEESLED